MTIKQLSGMIQQPIEEVCLRIAVLGGLLQSRRVTMRYSTFGETLRYQKYPDKAAFPANMRCVIIRLVREGLIDPVDMRILMSGVVPLPLPGNLPDDGVLVVTELMG